MRVYKTRVILLIVLFSIASTTILILAWSQPMPVADRILSTSVGAIGLIGVLIQALILSANLSNNLHGHGAGESSG